MTEAVGVHREQEKREYWMGISRVKLVRKFLLISEPRNKE